MSNKKNIFKKVIVLSIIIVLLNSFSTFSTLLKSESSNTSILLQIGSPVMIVNGMVLQIDPISTETAPVIIESRTFLPIRTVIETIGGQVNENEENKQITIDVNGQNIVFFIGNPQYTEAPVYYGEIEGMKTMGLYGGSKIIMVNGQIILNDVPAIIIDDRTYMPVRFIIENAGGEVGWDDANKVVSIMYPDPS